MPTLQLDNLFLFFNYTTPNLDSGIFEVHDIFARQFLSCLFILILITTIPYSIIKLTKFRAAYIVLLSLSLIHSLFMDLVTSTVFEPEGRSEANLKLTIGGLHFLLKRSHVQFYIRIFTPYYHWTASVLLTMVYILFVDTRKPLTARIQMFQYSVNKSNLLLLFTIPIVVILTILLVYLSYEFYIATLFGQIIAGIILLLLVRRSAGKWSKHFHRYQTTEFKKAKNRILATLNVYLCSAMAVCALFLTPVREAAFSYFIVYEFVQWIVPLAQSICIWIYVICYSKIQLPPSINPLKAQGDTGIPITDLKTIFSNQAPNADRVIAFLELREQMSSTKNSTEPGNSAKDGKTKF